MDLLFALTLSFMLLLFSTIKNYFIAYPLLLSLGIFTGVLLNRGFPLKALIKMGFVGSRKSFSVLEILLLIGMVIASWMAAGTVPAIVYYGIHFISPQFFIFAAFVLTSAVSLLIGTSFGAVGTIGVALMIMSTNSGVDPHIIAGAVIAGAYLGDRCSPMSSSANLIAAITQTKLYTNIRNMWITSLMPLLIAGLFYLVLSALHPVQITDRSFISEINRLVRIHPIDLLPTAIILILSMLQIEVKLSMLLSSLGAIAIAVFYQHYSLFEMLKFMLIGFSIEDSTSISSMFSGGGILSMVKISIVVILSTAFAGIFAETRILENIEVALNSVKSRSDCFLSTILIGIGSAAFGCTQTIAILMTQQLMEQKYKENEKGNYNLALDLENTVVVISPLIPWNIAGLVPATILNTDAGFIPFACYLYLIPLLNLIYLKLSKPPKPRLCNSRLKKKTSSSSSPLLFWQNVAKPGG